jgi:hypothetical protein
MRVTRSFPFKVALYVVLLAAMVFSTTQLYLTKASADSAACCSFGNQCPDRALCCLPFDLQAPCSQTKPNYCSLSCPAS